MTQHYIPKIADHSTPLDTSWDKAQEWCNFVVFKPTWLPEGFRETSNKVRPESPKCRSSHKAEFCDLKRSLSIKQFLYDWAPPAYDYPCLWRNAKISTVENTPLPHAYLIGNAYLWFGLDYRRKPAATINRMRTQIEITVLTGAFDDQDIIQIVEGLTPADILAKESILATSFAELMFDYRHHSSASPVPTSYFKHTRSQSMKCYPYPVTAKTLDFSLLAGHWLTKMSIEGYRLDSLILFGQDQQHINEVDYYFESLIEPGSYVRFLVTKEDSENSIPYPPQFGDQVCSYAVQKQNNGGDLYHAWSKTNDKGGHSLIFKVRDHIVNCIIKPAPWTTGDWARDLCARVMDASGGKGKCENDIG